MENFFNKHKNMIFNLLFVCLCFFLLAFFELESDYFWHVKAGEYMMKHGLIRHDVFSWYVNSKYWVSHEWLFEIIIYLLKMIFGNIHVLIYCFLSLLLLVVILFVPNREKLLKNIPFTIAYLGFFALLIMFFIKARPHMLSFSFLAYTVFSLYDLCYNEDSKKIYYLPLVSIIWANFHGGSSNLVYLLCFFFAFFGSFSFKFSKIEAIKLSKKQRKKAILIGLVCIFSICLNIHGFKMILYPYQNMLDSTMLNSISEWHPSSLNMISHYCIYIYFLFVLFVFLFSKKKIVFLDFMFFLLGVFLGLKAIRFWMYSYILMNFFLLSYVSPRKYNKGDFQILFFISSSLVIIFVLSCFQKLPIKYYVDLNDDILTVIKQEKPKRLFNMYNYGGELIYNDIPVFIDGRADLYGKYNFKDYLAISKLNGDYIKLIEKYRFDYLLVSKNYSIYCYLKYQKEYEVIYEDDDLIFYKNLSY